MNTVDGRDSGRLRAQSGSTADGHRALPQEEINYPLLLLRFASQVSTSKKGGNKLSPKHVEVASTERNYQSQQRHP